MVAFSIVIVFALFVWGITRNNKNHDEALKKINEKNKLEINAQYLGRTSAISPIGQSKDFTMLLHILKDNHVLYLEIDKKMDIARVIANKMEIDTTPSEKDCGLNLTKYTLTKNKFYAKFYDKDNFVNRDGDIFEYKELTGTLIDGKLILNQNVQQYYESSKEFLKKSVFEKITFEKVDDFTT